MAVRRLASGLPGTWHLEPGTSQSHHSLVLLDQHGEQQRLERRDVRGVAGGGEVTVGEGEEFVKDELVFAAQGPAEAGQRGLFFLEKLCGGCKGASHVVSFGKSFHHKDTENTDRDFSCGEKKKILSSGAQAPPFSVSLW
jgi:hypothetical protein